METYKLSAYYMIACERVHEVMDDLYESLHDKSGNPITDYESVIDIVSSSRKEIYEELDLIKSIVSEYEGSQGRDHRPND